MADALDASESVMVDGVQDHVRQAIANLVSNALSHPPAARRFWRADSSRVGPKVGLGLSIVAAIAESHGGTATVANHPDGGAIFTVNLPLAAASGRMTEA